MYVRRKVQIEKERSFSLRLRFLIVCQHGDKCVEDQRFISSNLPKIFAYVHSRFVSLSIGATLSSYQ